MPPKNKNTVYARWLAGKLTKVELKTLAESGELKALEAMKASAKNMVKPDFDTEQDYEELLSKGNDFFPEPDNENTNLNMRVMLSIVLALVLCVGIYVFLSNNNEVKITAPNTQTAQHQIKAVNVELNDGSSITYNKKEANKKLVINLMGEAYFDILKDTGITVKTEKGTVEAVAATFNIRAWGNQFYVECYKGDVFVKSGTEDYKLKGETSVLFDNGKMIPKTLKHKAPFWQSGFSNYFNENMNAVFNELERQFDITINVPKTDKTFTGSFPHNDLKTALSNICLPNKIKFNISADKKTVDVGL